MSYDDVYVERQFSEETAQLLGGGGGGGGSISVPWDSVAAEDHCRLWVSNEFQHSGLHDDPARVFTTLLKMANGELALPS